MRWKRDGPQPPALSDLQERYQAASDAEDYDRQIEILKTITAKYPDVSWAWYDLGLRLKWNRDWRGSCDANQRALALVDSTVNDPAAWNLGIAATALSDWSTARGAWTAFGIQLPDGAATDPVEGDFGLTPIRLNPDPRFAEPLFMLNGIRYGTEVVWARRLCPARARITNVPFPDSGHRHGDVVLHDGDPVGERQVGDETRSVFNEIAVLETGPYPTLATIIDAAPDGDFETLQDLFEERGYAVEAWTTSVRLLCKACSEGTSDAAHDHPPDQAPQTDTVTLGIAAPAEEAEVLIDAWLAPRGLRRGPVETAEPSPGAEDEP